MSLAGAVDRSAVSVQSLHAEPEDRGWWWARSPQERLAAIEVMRLSMDAPQLADDFRVLEIAQREPR